MDSLELLRASLEHRIAHCENLLLKVKSGSSYEQFLFGRLSAFSRVLLMINELRND